MPWTREELQVFLSDNLLKENLESVVQELQEMQAGRGMIAANHDESLLQGDVYSGIPWVSRSEGALVESYRRVILISNSCDASPENPRALPLDLTVAPVLKLASYERMLSDGGVSSAALQDTVRAIKRQEKSHVIFIPQGAGVEEDMVALLDKIQSLPYEEFQRNAPTRLSVMTQRGFWVLLVKLSMHFLRPHEGVARHAA
mgnify:CR=1 FL=1